MQIIYASSYKHLIHGPTFILSSWCSYFTRAVLEKQMNTCEKKNTNNIPLPSRAIASSSFLTCPKSSVSSTVSGTLLGWANMSTESASDLIVTFGLPVIPVNTARTTIILAHIVECRERQTRLLWKSAGRQVSLLPVWTFVTEEGGGGSREKRLSRSCCLPVYFFVLLTKQTVSLYLALFFVCSHLSCQPLNVSAASQDELISLGTVIPLELLLVKQLRLIGELDALQPRLLDEM